VEDSLERYLDAAPRVGEDFARRGAGLRDLIVERTDQDTVGVRFRRGDSSRRLSLPFPVRDVESAVVALADRLQEKEIEEGDTSWPGCLPGHPHPPEPALVAGRASWRCPRTGEPIDPI
jgi:hypothetical protein